MTSLAPDSYIAPDELLEQTFGELSAGEAVLLLEQCLEAGAWDHALALCRVFRKRGIEDRALVLCEAIAQFLSGDVEAASAQVDQVLERVPGHLAAAFIKARMQARRGDRNGAVRLLVDLVQAYPDFPGAQGLLATLLMPGPHYRELLARIHQALEPKTYLEIGVASGATLSLATTAEIAVGVDPAEHRLEQGAVARARVFHEESDVFFTRSSPAEVFQGRAVDLAFIDGMHLFEYALRDLSHAESWASPGSTIVLHDCVPIVAVAARRTRASKFWVGDTWKLLLALAEYRPDLRVRTLLAPPSGLVVVRRLDPSSGVLRERANEIVERYRDLEYERAPGDWLPECHPVENSQAGLDEALA